MPEEESMIFGEAYRFYEKWRGTEIRTPEQWALLTAELHNFVLDHAGNRLALRLAAGLMDTFDDLYKGGQKPEIPDYFGRSDL